MPKITVEALLAAGYKEYPERLKQGVKHAFQKTIRGADDKKLYFINIYFWDLSGLPMPEEIRANNSTSVEVRFYRWDEDRGFDLTKHCEADARLVDIEAFYAMLYERMGCIPDIHNND